MNKDYSFSRRQLLGLCTVIFLSPALRLVPHAAAEHAGRAAWLAPFVALPGVMLYVGFINLFLARRKEDESLAELILRALGQRTGRAALFLFGLWFCLYGAFTLRAGSERIISTMYPDSGAALFTATMGALCLLSALDAPRTLVRAANIFLSAVLGVLFIVLLFALFSVRRENLLPVTVFDFPGILSGAASALDVAAMPLYAACFLTPLKRDRGSALRGGLLWAVGAMALLSCLMTAIVGAFGAELASRLTHPFFSLVKNLSFFNTVERVEAFVVSLWVFTDFATVSVCFIAASHSLRSALGCFSPYCGERLYDLRGGRWVSVVAAGGCLGLGLALAPGATALEEWSHVIIPWLNAAVAFAALPIIYIVGRTTKRL